MTDLSKKVIFWIFCDEFSHAGNYFVLYKMLLNRIDKIYNRNYLMYAHF